MKDESGREVTFPEWRSARPGQRVRRNGSGWTGTIEKVNPAMVGGWGVRVRWDQSGAVGRVVTPGYSLSPID